MDLTEFENKLIDTEVLQYLCIEKQLEDAQNLDESNAVDYLHNKLINLVGNVTSQFAINREQFLEKVSRESPNFKRKK